MDENSIKDIMTKRAEDALARTFGAVRLKETSSIIVKGKEVLLSCFIFPNEQLRRKAIGSAYQIDYPEVKLMLIMDSRTGEIYARAYDGELRGISHELIVEITKAPDRWID